jgi:predicted DNA-binding protein (UPF0251 family)
MAARKTPAKKTAARRAPQRSGPRIKLNQAVLDELLKHISAGVTQEVAARAIGVDPKTLRRWLAEGRAALAALETPGSKFRPSADDQMRMAAADAVEQARYKVEVALSANIVAASRGGQIIEKRTITHKDGSVEQIERRAAPDWRAAGFLLERTRRERWSRQVAITDPDGRAFGTGADENRRRYDMAKELSALMQGAQAPASQN